MPTYEYECLVCGHAFERFQRISDDPVQVCPECGGGVRRVISTGGGIVFKGPGFYATDYARKPTVEPGGSNEKASDGSEDPGKKDRKNGD